MKKLFFLFIFFGFNANAQIINIPDASFKSKLLNSINGHEFLDANHTPIVVDVNGDGEIEVSEAQLVYTIYFDVNSHSVNDLTGIQYFSNLRYLYLELANPTTLNLSGLNNLITVSTYACNNLASINLTGLTNLEGLDVRNGKLTSLDFTGLTSIKYLQCQGNLLTSIDVQGLPNLEYLYCGGSLFTNLNPSNLTHLRELNCTYSSLTQLNLNSLPALEVLYCTGNQLNSIDVSDCGSLKIFECSNNNLSSLDISSNPLLEALSCSDNHLTTLDVMSNPLLQTLYCRDNLLTTLDIMSNTQLYNLNCNNNSLVSLFLKNGNNESVSFSNNSDLMYICGDESQIANLQTNLNQYGYTNCNVNSYCSFTPGGAFYTIQGNNKFDSDNNGCNASDLAMPNLKFNITDGTISGSLISNASGNYSIPVQTGTHTVTPVFENPSYFTASPANVVVNFPTQASPFVQNFCIKANGIHPDLEVVLVPLTRARAGFNAIYELIYKNKGNTVQSGTVTLNFNDAILDLITANPVVNNQTLNNLSWNFVNLLPFETRQITIVLNVNSPIETPAVNSGDILNYTTTITSVATDETPNDNVFTLNQTVLNSFDPNDKTCLEGATISPSKVGDYVHYMIRFENNGSANAQNIVVKDMIDTTKFDVNSIVSIKGSHPFVTKISSGNNVEFIFENINLPFDDANNDGFVAFKIKTKPTLTNGDTFSNTASIYFDYNFPIVTNAATTTIASLSVQDFEFEHYFNIYPNPVHSVLNISTKESIEVSSVSVYNTLGQLVLLVPNAQNVKMVDVSTLTSGNYFIKINSDKGTSNTKFIKN